MIEVWELAGIDPAHRFSPFCWRTRMALAHKGLEPATHAWRFGEADSLPGAPQQRTVPVMRDGGMIVADSSGIAHYLETHYENRPSLFGGPVGEAHARFVVAWADTVLQPAIFPIVAPDVARFVRPEALPEWRAAREARLGMTLEAARVRRGEFLPALNRALLPARRALEPGGFFGGNEPSYADYAVFGAFQWARLTCPVELLAEDDALRGWRERVLDLFDGLARQAAHPKLEEAA